MRRILKQAEQFALRVAYSLDDPLPKALYRGMSVPPDFSIEDLQKKGIGEWWTGEEHYANPERFGEPKYPTTAVITAEHPGIEHEITTERLPDTTAVGGDFGSEYRMKPGADMNVVSVKVNGKEMLLNPMRMSTGSGTGIRVRD